MQEDRIPLQVWVTQKTSGLLMDEGQSGGEFSLSFIYFKIYVTFTFSHFA